MNTKFITISTMVVFCFVLTSLQITAQSKEHSDTVVLKNGTVLNDVKVEESYIVTTSGGKSTTYKKEEVSEVKKADGSKGSGSGENSAQANSAKDAPPAGSENWSANLGYMNWEDAKAKCAEQKMKLPTIEDLKSAQDAKITDSWKKAGYLYWSSSIDTSQNPQLLYAYKGEVYSLSRYSQSYVRCMK